MATNPIQICSRNYRWKDFSWILSQLGRILLTYFASFIFSGWLANGSIISTRETNSSPSNILATKGSSVWLHWSYTYIGDGTHEENTHFIVNYKEQIIGFNRMSQPSFQVLAQRAGQSGALTLVSPVPSPFSGRVEMISSNSTLVIHNLQYSDSNCQFSSNIYVNINTGAGKVLHEFGLKPIVSLTVIGIPEFTAKLPSEVEVNEHAPLVLRIEMEGNPKPNAYFKWTHSSSVAEVKASSSRTNKFQYHATYKLNSTNASFCGRRLQTILRNNIGSSTAKTTRVIVLLKLEQPLNTKAERALNSGCIKVTWKKIESADCVVKYIVKLRDAHGTEVDERYGYNIGSMNMCHTLPYIHVTEAQLTVQFRAVSKTATAIVLEEGSFASTKKVFTTQDTTQSSVTNLKSTLNKLTSNVSTLSVDMHKSKPESSFGLTKIIIILTGSLIIILLMMFLAILISRRNRIPDNRQGEARAQTKARDTDMDLLPQRRTIVQLYGDLENEYEEIEELST